MTPSPNQERCADCPYELREENGVLYCENKKCDYFRYLKPTQNHSTMEGKVEVIYHNGIPVQANGVDLVEGGVAPMEWRKRCDKCNGPFEAHHWQHYSPREDKTYHTGCFEQYKFPSLLAKERESAERRIRDAVLGYDNWTDWERKTLTRLFDSLQDPIT